MTKQLFFLTPKIREVDDYVRRVRTKRLRETHPELVFLKLNKNKLFEYKKTAIGQRKRLRLLAACGFSELEKWCRELAGKGAKIDDLLDACAAAVAAQNLERLDCKQEVDGNGLAMEMWC
jgi:predicted RNase H-like nuclease